MLYTEFLKEPRQCPFCSPGQRVVSDAGVAYLTYALAPYHRHHLLVLPRRHVLFLHELREDEVTHCLQCIQKGVRILEQLGYTDYSVLVRSGSDSGKSVEHLHIHVVPNVHLGDTDHAGNLRTVLEPAEAEVVVRELQDALVRLV